MRWRPRLVIMTLDSLGPEEKKWLIICEVHTEGRTKSRRRLIPTFAKRDDAVTEVERLNREEFTRLDTLGYLDANGHPIDPGITIGHYSAVHLTDLSEIDWECRDEW